MPISAHLLKKAYQLIDAGQLHNSALVLDAIVRRDPNNVMAWKAYLQICQEYKDLEWVMERISKVAELCESDKADIRAFQNYLIQRMSKRNQNADETIPARTYQVSLPSQEDSIIFELIDEYDVPSRKIEREKRKKSRLLFKYNVPMYVWQAAALLAVFTISVRLLVTGSLLGLLLMEVFVIGGINWLRSFKSRKSNMPLDSNHAYALDSENELFIIDKHPADAKIEKNKATPAKIRYLDE